MKFTKKIANSNEHYYFLEEIHPSFKDSFLKFHKLSVETLEDKSMATKKFKVIKSVIKKLTTEETDQINKKITEFKQSKTEVCSSINNLNRFKFISQRAGHFNKFKPIASEEKIKNFSIDDIENNLDLMFPPVIVNNVKSNITSLKVQSCIINKQLKMLTEDLKGKKHNVTFYMEALYIVCNEELSRERYYVDDFKDESVKNSLRELSSLKLNYNNMQSLKSNINDNSSNDTVFLFDRNTSKCHSIKEEGVSCFEMYNDVITVDIMNNTVDFLNKSKILTRNNTYYNNYDSIFHSPKASMPDLYVIKDAKELVDNIIIAAPFVEGINLNTASFVHKDKISKLGDNDVIIIDKFIFIQKASSSTKKEDNNFYSKCMREIINKPIDQKSFQLKFAKVFIKQQNKKINELKEAIEELETKLSERNKEFGELTLTSNFIKNGFTNMFSDLIDKISKLQIINSTQFSKNSIILKTASIFNISYKDYPIYIGEFEITLSILGKGSISVRNTAAPNNKSQHPHGDDDYICLGGFSSTLQNCLKKADYYSLILTVLNMLEHINPKDYGAVGRVKEHFKSKIKPNNIFEFSESVVILGNRSD